MNLQAKEAPSNKEQKLGFISSFFASCLNLGFYTRAHRASWLHVILHALVLIIFISIAYSAASFNLLQNGLQGVFKDVPTLVIKNNQIQIPENVELPYIKKFPQSAGREMVYMVDSGDKQAQLEEESDMYVLFTKKEAILSDGNNRKVFPAKQLEKDPFLKNFFGNPLTLSSGNLAKFTAFYTVIILGFLFLFLPLLIIFPIFNSLAALIASIIDRWTINFPDIVKLAVFAATPACLIQVFGCFLLVLNWSIFLLGLFISWAIQLAYLITGLKACKAAEAKN
jgi:hypothetical protein